MSGVLLIDKPDGPTSHDVVVAIRALVPGEKVGHSGTLDPHATGLLLVLVGKATKVSRFLMGLDKEYVFSFRLGVETDTHDRWGRALGEHDPGNVRPEEVMAVVSGFLGTYDQEAPSISALKHRGTPLYKLARQGQPTPARTREVAILGAEILDMSLPVVTVRLTCSTGTYVRALARDIGRRLGCGAMVTDIRRTRIGSFDLTGAVSLPELVSKRVPVETVMLDIGSGLGHMPQVMVKSEAVNRIRMGGQPASEDIQGGLDFECGHAKLVDQAGEVIGIVKRGESQQRPLKIVRII
jgi:tRNA pseudouridine55 synthase